jgi:hypothetical protein
MADYLKTSNSKLGVFRDVIIEADYDPLLAREAGIRILTGGCKCSLAQPFLPAGPLLHVRLCT